VYHDRYGVDRFMEEPLPPDTCASCGWTMEEELAVYSDVEMLDPQDGSMEVVGQHATFTCPACGRQYTTQAW
jgi:predicted RNA-binding Zn-ribbon protein involved in translation (DUF1610 family)